MDKKNIELQIWNIISGFRSHFSAEKIVIALIYKLYRELDRNINLDACSILESELSYEHNLLNQLEDINYELFRKSYTEVIEHLLDYQKNNIRNFIEFSQPQELTNLIINIIQKKVHSLYNPFGGIASYIVSLTPVKYLAEEISPLIWALAQVRLSAYGISGKNYLNRNSFETLNNAINNSKDDLFDFVIMTPPFGLTKNYEYDYSNEELEILGGISKLKNDGKMIIVVPNNFLFKISQRSITLRKDIIDNRWLEMIISLPPNIFNYTGILTSIIVLSKNVKHNVRMIDASSFIKISNNKHNILDDNKLIDILKSNKEIDTISAFIDFEEIAKNDFNYLPSRYFSTNQEIPESFKSINIKDICKNIEPLASYEEEVGSILKISDLKHSFFNYTIDANNLYKSTLEKPLRKYTSPFWAISLIRGIKFAYCIASEKTPIFCSPLIHSFEIDEKIIHPTYFAYSLLSEFLTTQINAFSQGITIKNVRINDFLSMKILIPIEYNKQQELIDKEINYELEKRVKELGIELDVLKYGEKNQYEKNMRLRKHSMAQVMNQFSSAFDLIFKCKEKNNGILENDMIVSQRTGENVESYFIKMKSFIKKMESLLDTFSDDKIFPKPEWIWIETFLEELPNKYATTNYTINFNHNWIIAEHDIYDLENDLIANQGEKLNSFAINIAKNELERVLDNIISNAIKHGFTDSNRTDYSILITIREDTNNDSLIISIANNGNPLSPTMNAEKYFTWGEGVSTGLGGWETKNIVEHYGGKVELISDPNNEYPLEINLIFPIVNRF